MKKLVSYSGYWLEQVSISNGTYNNREPVVITYNVYKSLDSKHPGVFVRDNLLMSRDLTLYLKREDNNGVNNPIITKVSDLFIAPKASFFLVTNMNEARGATKTGEKINLTPLTSRYCNGINAVKSELISGNTFVGQVPSENSIANLLNNLQHVKQVIDYVFSKPPLLFSVGAILRNEAGDQHLFADAGNAPHPHQLMINMESNRQRFWDKLHSGTRFGIASYYLYAKRIYKSVFKLDIGDYIVISIAYYPMVKPPETSDVGISDIVEYYNSRIGNYRHSIYSFHLWRYALYGGFAGVAGGDYYNDGYKLRPECACRTFKLMLDAQQQPEYKKAWYHVLVYPTALYLLLLFLATTKQNESHNKKVTENAINELRAIFKDENTIESKIQNDVYKNIIRRFIEEIGKNALKTIVQEGLTSFLLNSKEVSNYDNPIQMLWKYCMNKIVKPVHERTKSNINESVLSNRISEIEEYMNNKIESIKSDSDLYRQILQKELQFFNS